MNLWRAASISECGRLRRARHLAGVGAAHRPARVAYEYEALWLWNMPRPEYGIWRRGPRPRANGRSLIYETGAAPPPVITVYLVRARAAARSAASRSVPLQMASGAPGSSPPPRPALRTSEARAAASAECKWTVHDACHAPPLNTMPRVKPACVRRVSIGT